MRKTGLIPESIISSFVVVDSIIDHILNKLQSHWTLSKIQSLLIPQIIEDTLSLEIAIAQEHTFMYD